MLHFICLIDSWIASIGSFPTKEVCYKSGGQSVMIATFVDYEDCGTEVLFQINRRIFELRIRLIIGVFRFA